MKHKQTGKLVITWKQGESIQVGEMTLIGFKYSGRGQIKVCFQGPREIPILRSSAIKKEPK